MSLTYTHIEKLDDLNVDCPLHMGFDFPMWAY